MCQIYWNIVENEDFYSTQKKWLPGPISTTPDNLLIALNEIIENDKYKQKRCLIKELMFDEYNNCSQRVVDSLFKAHQS